MPGPAYLPVPLDFSHICHATNTKTEVFTAKGTSNGACDAGLAHTWRAMEAEDLALGGPSELADSYELLWKPRKISAPEGTGLQSQSPTGPSPSSCEESLACPKGLG